jgi:hypothetical protein
MLSRRSFGLIVLSAVMVLTAAWAAVGITVRPQTALGAATRASALPARCCVGMAYDSLHQNVVMFGGLDNNNAVLGETWVWDGTSWSQRNPTASPCPRRSTRAAYDGISQKVLVFGGVAGNGCPVQAGKTLADTWLWDGTNWTQCLATCSTHPGNREGEGLAYDSVRQQVVLFGGTGKATSPAETGPPSARAPQ